LFSRKWENQTAQMRYLLASIARIQEFHSANLPIPEHLLAELKSEAGSITRQTASAEGPHRPGRLPGERPASPSDHAAVGDALGDDFGDNDGVDNDENALALRHPEQNEIMSASFSQEQGSGRRAKTVNVGVSAVNFIVESFIAELRNSVLSKLPFNP